MPQQLTRSPIRRNDKKMVLVVADGLGGVQLFVRHVKPYGFTIVFRGDGFHANANDSDPRTTGVAPNRIEAGGQEAEQTFPAASEFVKKAAGCLRDSHPTDMVLLCGAASLPNLAGIIERPQLVPRCGAAFGKHLSSGPGRVLRGARSVRRGLGQFRAKHLMPLVLAHAERLDKFGA